MRTRARKVVLLTAAAALAATLPALPATAATPADSRVAGVAFEVQFHDAASVLPLADEDRTGYTRTSFRHWIDSDKDGCDARREVLIAESIEEVTVGPRCTLTGGRWYSAYDDRYLDSPSLIDIDHFVPLAEAWDSGADEWTAAERQAYANDLDDERLLIAVSASSNRSKADKDPAEWMPPHQAYACEYTVNWIAMKLRWGLTVDPVEQQALADQAAACPDVEITGVHAR